MSTVRHEERQEQAIRAAVAVAVCLGMASVTPVVLRDSNHTNIHLAPFPVVARVAASSVGQSASARLAAILSDDRIGAPVENIFWSGNLAEAGHVLYGFQSMWMPASLLSPGQQAKLADTLFAASRQHPLELHFQKGLLGASNEVIAAAADTATNPDVLGAFMLVIVAGEGPPAYPGLIGHEPNLANARNEAGQIDRAMQQLKPLAPSAGSYVPRAIFSSQTGKDRTGESTTRAC